MRVLTTRWVGDAWQEVTEDPKFMKSTFEGTGLSLPISDTHVMYQRLTKTLIDGSLDERIHFYGHDELVEVDPLSDSSSDSDSTSFELFVYAFENSASEKCSLNSRTHLTHAFWGF